jgi:DNA-nicking Smr family endonuclease
MGMDDWLDKYPPENVTKDTEINTRESFPVSKKKLRKKPAESVLDLHGLTAEEARVEVENFLKQSKINGFRKVLIIHGKGYHSSGKPVLKGEVVKLLEKNPVAGEFGTADRKDGGSGAVWVLLK